MKEKIKLAIFDFDGTLVDSEPNYDRSSDLLYEQLGISLSEDQRAGLVGISTQSFADILIRDFGLSISAAELVALSDRLYLEIARQETPIFAPMHELLQRLHKAGIRCAVASGSSQGVLDEIIDICGFGPYLSGVYSADLVKKGKPDPDIFLYTAEKLGAKPHECLVFEDSMPGIFAAHQAGIRAIAVPVEEQFAHPVFQSAWLTYPGAQNLSVKSVMYALGLPYTQHI